MAGPSFHFRLERVRALRERKQKLAEQELALAIRGRSQSEQELQQAQASLLRAHSEQRDPGAGLAFGADELRARQAFLERLEAQHGRHARELERRSAEVTRRDQLLTTAASEHKMINRLRDRHRFAHERELARREQGTLDEIASVRFRRSVSR